MNGVNFRYGKYMNGSCFSLSLVYEWGGVRGLQPHIRTQNHGKLPPPPPWLCTYCFVFLVSSSVLNPHKTVCWHYICLNYSFKAGSGNQAYRPGGVPILSVVSVVVSRIGRGLVVQNGDLSVERTGVGREEPDLSVGASGIQRGYSGCLSGIDTLFSQNG